MSRLSFMWNKIKMLVREDAGQTAVEYTLLLAVILLAIVLTAPEVGTTIEAVWQDVLTEMQQATE